MTPAKHPSFSSAWKLLTKEKGWYKPVIILTLVGWIPVAGQIAIMGYALEWARLIAWGSDAAPKQRDVKYGKVLGSGFRAFMVMLTLGIVLALIDLLLFGTSTAIMGFPAWSGMGTGAMSLLTGGIGLGGYLVMLVFNLFVGTFIQAAALRAVIYDQFSAGWRLDRLVQMIADDLGGFARTYLVTLVAGVVNWAYSALLALICALMAYGGVMGLVVYGAMHGVDTDMDIMQMLARMLFRVGPSALLLVVVLAIAFGLVGMFIGTALQLVCTAALGQWFRAFDVARWGTSNDPLPQGAPFYEGAPATPSSSSAPHAPEGFSQADGIDADVVEDAVAGVAKEAAGESAAESAPEVAEPVDAEVAEPVDAEVEAVFSEKDAEATDAADQDSFAADAAEKPAPAPWDEVLDGADAEKPAEIFTEMDETPAEASQEAAPDVPAPKADGSQGARETGSDE